MAIDADQTAIEFTCYVRVGNRASDGVPVIWDDGLFRFTDFLADITERGTSLTGEELHEYARITRSHQLAVMLANLDSEKRQIMSRGIAELLEFDDRYVEGIRKGLVTSGIEVDS